MVNQPKQITPEHQAILDRILPRMREEHARLQQRLDHGERWEDLSSNHSFEETRDSAHLVYTGKFHAGLDTHGESTIGLDVTKDVRLARVIDKSFEIKDKYGPNQSQLVYYGVLREVRKEYDKYDVNTDKYLDEINTLTKQRNAEKNSKRKDALNNQLVAKEQEFAEYYDTRSNGKNKPEQEIQDFPSGWLVCREYAAISSMALHYAGIENYHAVGTITHEHGVDTGRHAYIVSKKSGNVLNVTAIGSDIPIEHCYARVINKSADFTKGETLVALEADGTYTCYGTGRDSNGVCGDYTKVGKYDRQLIKEAQNGRFDQAVAERSKNLQNTTPGNIQQPDNKKQNAETGVKQDFLAEWTFKDGVFVNLEGRKVKLAGEGNGRGYHFHDLGCSLVPQGGDKFTIFYADKSHERITITDSNEPQQQKQSTSQLVRNELKEHWQLKDGQFVSDEGKTVKLTGEGNGRAYHFHDKGFSLIPQGGDKFTIYYADKSVPPERFTVAGAKPQPQHGHSMVEQSIKSELRDKWNYQNGQFISLDGKSTVKLTGEGNGKAFHFHNLECSLVPQNGGGFAVFYKDPEGGRAKMIGKISEQEVNGSSKKSTAMLEEASKLMSPLAGYNSGQEKSYNPVVMLDNVTINKGNSHQV